MITKDNNKLTELQMVVNNSYDERLEIHENDNDITRCVRTDTASD